MLQPKSNITYYKEMEESQAVKLCLEQWDYVIKEVRRWKTEKVKHQSPLPPVENIKDSWPCWDYNGGDVPPARVDCVLCEWSAQHYHITSEIFHYCDVCPYVKVFGNMGDVYYPCTPTYWKSPIKFYNQLKKIQKIFQSKEVISERD